MRNHSNESISYSEVSGYFSVHHSRCVHGSYFFNLFIGKLGIFPFYPFRNPFRISARPMVISNRFSAFRDFISLVIQSGSQKQVAWVNASWVISFVKHAQAIWNFSKVNYPRTSVRSILCFSKRSVSELSVISFSNQACSPLPAFTKLRSVRLDWTVLVDFLKKLKNWRVVSPRFFHKQKNIPPCKSDTGALIAPIAERDEKRFSNTVQSGINAGLMISQIQNSVNAF